MTSFGSDLVLRHNKDSLWFSAGKKRSMTYSTKFSTELNLLQQHIQRHFCQLEEAFSALNSLEKQVPGTAHSRTGQSWGNVTRATASTWFRSGWFQRLLYQGCHPCLTASGYCACSRDTSNSRDAHNWSFNYHSIQFKHSKLWGAPLGRRHIHPPASAAT